MNLYFAPQVIAAVVAKDQDSAQRAARAVRVEYRDLPAVVTIEEAVAAGSFHEWPNNVIVKGDAERAFSEECDHVIEGEMRTGAQEHFYLETQASLAVPAGEDGELTVYASTQNPTETQAIVAEVLGLPMNKVWNKRAFEICFD